MSCDSAKEGWRCMRRKGHKGMHRVELIVSWYNDVTEVKEAKSD